MAKSPAFQFYPKQWLGDDNVMLMDWDARAMHMHFMCIAWQQQEPCTLPDDDKILRKWVGNPDEWDRLKEQIFRAWKLDSGRWIQSGLLAEYLKQKSFSEKRKKAAETRWGDKKPDANALHMECSSSSSSTSSTDIKTKPSRGKREAQSVDVRFTPSREFIEKCYRHVDIEPVWDGGEAKQLQNFLKAAPGLDLDAIKELVRNRFRSAEPKGKRAREWIPNLSSYANGPLDRFNKPEENGNGRKQQTYADKNQAGTVAAVRTVIAKYRGMDSGRAGIPSSPVGPTIDSAEARRLRAGVNDLPKPETGHSVSAAKN